MFDLETPGVQERRIHERVRLRDVAAVLPIDTLVDVVGRAEITPDGASRIRNVEHIIVLDEDAYETLRHLVSMQSARERTPRGGGPGVRAEDVAKYAALWDERGAAFERNATGDGDRIDPCARRLGTLCRQAQGEFEGLAQRASSADVDGADEAPQPARAA